MDITKVLNETFYLSVMLPDPSNPNDKGQVYGGWSMPKIMTKGRASGILTKWYKQYAAKEKEWQQYLADPQLWEKNFRDYRKNWYSSQRALDEQVEAQRPKDRGPFRGVIIPVNLSHGLTNAQTHITYEQILEERKVKKRKVNEAP